MGSPQAVAAIASVLSFGADDNAKEAQGAGQALIDESRAERAELKKEAADKSAIDKTEQKKTQQRRLARQQQAGSYRSTRGGTILTSPLGIAGAATTANKTLLGV